MAYTQYGPPELGDWVPQPDFQAQQSKEGGWTATQSYTISRDSIDLETFQDEFRVGRPIEDLFPDVEGYWRFLGLASIPRVRHIRGGYSLIAVKYAGFTAPSGQGTDPEEEEVPEPVPTYMLRGTIIERDIMLHPKVIALNFQDDWDILKGLLSREYVMHDFGDGDKVVCTHPIDEQGVETFWPLPQQPTAGDCQNFALKIAAGVHTYKFPSFNWMKTWDATIGIKPAEVNNLGLIDVPDGDPPAIDGDRDWMLMSATQEQDGLKFRNTKEWGISDRGGWDTLLYEE